MATIARRSVEGCVPGIVRAAGMVVTTRAAQTAARTPLVPLPFVTLTSVEYVLPAESEQVIAPTTGSRAIVTITVFPAGTMTGDVTEVEVAAVWKPAEAIKVGGEMAASETAAPKTARDRK